MEDTEFADRLASIRETRARLPEVVRNRHATRRRRRWRVTPPGCC